jgi:choline/glycine/proline betaine transport protein
MTKLIAEKGVLSGANAFMAVSSAALVLVFLTLTIFNLELADDIYVGLQRLISARLTGSIVWAVTLIAGFSILLAISPYGAIRLGGDDEGPAFGIFSWFAMLFSAGVGTGILFWSVAEPNIHYQGNPFIDLAGIEPGTCLCAWHCVALDSYHDTFRLRDERFYNRQTVEVIRWCTRHDIAA